MTSGSEDFLLTENVWSFKSRHVELGTFEIPVVGGALFFLFLVLCQSCCQYVRWRHAVQHSNVFFCILWRTSCATSELWRDRCPGAEVLTNQRPQSTGTVQGYFV